jgi:hypothetical protein
MFFPFARFLLILGAFFLLAGEAKAQATDTSSTSVEQPGENALLNHSPRGALRRALIVPGWGQVYNRQYWKLPIVYAGIGSVTALAIGFGKQHRLYTRAYQYKAWEEKVERGEEETNLFPDYQDEYQKVISARCGGCEVNSSAIRPFRDKFRRNRDLSLFGIGLVYGLSVLDAFVNAHLLDFDVGEDLTVQVYPFAEGVAASVRIGL